jgi:hypothetical protein
MSVASVFSGLSRISRGVVAMLLFAAPSACTRDPRAGLAEIMPCADVAFSRGTLDAHECRLEANDETMHFKFAAVEEGAGDISAEIIGARGEVRQVISETGVFEYLLPHVHDVDGDGRADLLIPRSSGNVNTVSAVWLFNGERGVYERVGEINGVSVNRTEDGLVAVASRSNAASWNVAFHRLDQSGLLMVASVDIEGMERVGETLRTRCRLADAPGIEALGLSPADANAKFCSEPATINVFEQ